MTDSVSDLWDPEIDADRFRADPEADAVLVGGVDLHTHPYPSPFPRRISIVEAAADAASLGFKAIVVKSHHHSMQTDVLALQAKELKDIPVEVYGGIALNQTVGGLNAYAVELALRMGGRVVWFPTIASHAHIDFHHDHESGFPTPSGFTLRDNEPISVLDESGKVSAAAHEVIDVIVGESAVLNCGHLPAREIDVLIPTAIEAGVERIVISHPTFIIEADPERIGGWCRQGAYVEHCTGMLTGRMSTGDPFGMIADYYKAAGPGQTIFSSDLGQKGTQLPMTAYRKVARALLDAGLPAETIKSMTGGNAAQLLAR